MCGIAGIFHVETAKPVDPERVKRMTDAIAHRGPDGSGVWTAPGVGLGHRRLSIIDLEGGAQPMHSDDGALTLTFNGEIYNFRELRTELEAAGYSFSTQSDSEVILHGWRHSVNTGAHGCLGEMSVWRERGSSPRFWLSVWPCLG